MFILLLTLSYYRLKTFLSIIIIIIYNNVYVYNYTYSIENKRNIINLAILKYKVFN